MNSNNDKPQWINLTNLTNLINSLINSLIKNTTHGIAFPNEFSVAVNRAVLRILSDRATRRQYDRARFDEARAKSQVCSGSLDGTGDGEVVVKWW